MYPKRLATLFLHQEMQSDNEKMRLRRKHRYHDGQQLECCCTIIYKYAT